MERRTSPTERTSGSPIRMTIAAVVLGFGFVVAACGSTGSTDPALTPSPTDLVVSQGPDQAVVDVHLVDRTGTLMAARGSTGADNEPLIQSETGPWLGSVPEMPRQLRVLWTGGVCDTRFQVIITTNDRGGYHFDISAGPPSHPSCDAIGVVRGVVITFSGPVDAATATGEMHPAP